MFIIIISAFVPSATVFVPHLPVSHELVIAAETLDYKVLTPLPGTTADCPDTARQGDSCKTRLPLYLPGLVKLLIGVAAGLAVLMMIFGGIQYMSTDAIFDKKEGKKKIGAALGGLLLAILSWLILNTINPDLIKTGFKVPEQPTTASSTPSSTADQFKAEIKFHFKNTIGPPFVTCSPEPTFDRCMQGIPSIEQIFSRSPYIFRGARCTLNCVTSPELPYPPYYLRVNYNLPQTGNFQECKPHAGPYQCAQSTYPDISQAVINSRRCSAIPCNPDSPPPGTEPTVPGWYIKTTINGAVTWGPGFGLFSACFQKLVELDNQNPLFPPSGRTCTQIL